MQRIASSVGRRVLSRGKTQSRMFSSAEASEAHHIETMNRWKQISYAAIPVCGVLAVYNVYAHLSHGHHGHEERLHYAYEKIRNKPFPWKNSDCGLFDGECQAKADAAAKALA